jgi:lipopolysaccharide export system permease protein
LVFALFTFVIYFNLVNLGQSWVAGGKLSLTTYMLALHGGVFLLAVLWLTKGHNNWHWRRLLPKPSTAAQVNQAEP